MKKYLLVVIIILTTSTTYAQFIKEKSISAEIGYGVTVPFNTSDDVVNTGFFAQGQLILKVSSWIDLKPYAALIITNSDDKDIDGNPTDVKAESKALLLGGKARVKVPIPYVAPYFEIGIGSSIGRFVTFTPVDDIDKNLITFHIPFSMGLELGKYNKFDIGLTYFIQPSIEQFIGAFVVGMTFPIN